MCTSVSTATSLMTCKTAVNINILTTTDVHVTGACLTLVSGNVNIDGSASNMKLATVVLSSLTHVSGYFQVWNSQFGTGGVNTALTLIDVKRLAFVGGYVTIQFNSAISNITLPALTYVGMYLDIDDNNALTTLTLPALTYISQYILVQNNVKLANVSAPAMVKIGATLISAVSVTQLCFNSVCDASD